MEEIKTFVESFGTSSRNSAVDQVKSIMNIESKNGNLNNDQLLTKVSLKTNIHSPKNIPLSTSEHVHNQENASLREVKCNHSDMESSAEEENGNLCMQYSISIMCQKNDKGGILDTDPYLSSKTAHKTVLELTRLSVQELRIILQDLSQSVEGMSSKLVSLLLENDALQQESNARNVSIEQLLKLTWKHAENELRTVQMSVILPPPSNETHIN